MKSAATNKECSYIPQATYEKIVKCMPIVSVEALIVVDGKLLFLRRNNEPVKGEWWFPGGRVRKGESLEQALFREVKEETGMETNFCKLINVYSRVFPERHDITIAYLCSTNSSKVVLNEEHSEYAFFKKLPRNLHPYMREVVMDSILEKG